MIKIPEEILLDLKVDEATIMRQLLNIEEKTKEVDEMIEKTGKKTEKTWLLAVGVSQASYQLIESLTGLMGMTMGRVMKQIISGVFTTATILTSLLSATAIVPGMQIVAGIGLGMVALAIGNAIIAERKYQQEESRYAQNINQILGDVNSLVGSFNF